MLQRVTAAALGALGCAIGFILAQSQFHGLTARAPSLQYGGRFLAGALFIGIAWSMLRRLGVLAPRTAAPHFDLATLGYEIASFAAMALVFLLLSPALIPVAAYQSALAVATEMGIGLVYELAPPPIFLVEHIALAWAVIFALRLWWRRRWYADWRFLPVTCVLALASIALAFAQNVALQGLTAYGAGRAIAAGRRRGWWLGVLGFGRLTLLLHVTIFLLGGVFHSGFGFLVANEHAWMLSALTVLAATGIVAAMLWPRISKETDSIVRAANQGD
jgi:hypothetical protein